MQKKVEEKTSLGRRRAELRYALHLLRQNPLVLVGSVISVASIILALASPLIVNPNSWKLQNLDTRLCWNNNLIQWPVQNLNSCPPNQWHLLGTDTYGRDVFEMIILALPLDLEFSFAIIFAASVLGVLLGAMASFVGGWLDEVILRMTDVFFAVPGLLLAIIFVSVAGRNLTILGIAVFLTWWPSYVRLERSQILTEKEKPYVDALRVLGVKRLRLLFLHVLPNSIYTILVQATLDLGRVILVFSALMFLGFSPNPLIPELGNLVNEGIKNVFTAPWLIIFPGITILIVCLGFNLLGDGIRDILDPRLRR